MAYSDFTLEAAARVLGVISRPAELFPQVQPSTAPGWLSEAIARGGQGIHLSLISEKSQMVAADLFNQAAGRPGTPIFGCVTTGEAWQFLRLKGTEALMDRQRYYIDNVGIILGIIQTIAAEGPRPT